MNAPDAEAFEHFTTGLLALLKSDCRALSFWIAVNDVNMTDRLGCTLLMHACRSGDIEVASLFIEANARTDLRDFKGRSALDFANECDEGTRAALMLLLSASDDG